MNNVARLEHSRSGVLGALRLVRAALRRFKEVPPGLPAFVRHGRPDFHKYMPLFCAERRAELAAASGAVFACGQSEMVTGVWDASVQASLKHGVTWAAVSQGGQAAGGSNLAFTGRV